MRRRLVIVAAAAVVAIGLGVGLGVGLSGSGNGSSVGADQSEVASVQAGCEQWLHGAPTEPGKAGWCTAMTQWMVTYMGRYGLGPQTMWGDPGRLAAACERWLTTSPPPGAPADETAWCTAMASWMGGNMQRWSGQSSWGDWMRYGPMGGPGGQVGR